MSTMQMQIRIYLATDPPSDETESAYDAAYEGAITERIIAAYPEAALKIERRHIGPTRVWVFDCPPEIERDVKSDVERTIQDVWDDADFWPPRAE